MSFDTPDSEWTLRCCRTREFLPIADISRAKIRHDYRTGSRDPADTTHRVGEATNLVRPRMWRGYLYCGTCIFWHREALLMPLTWTRER